MCGGYDKSSRHRSRLDLNPGRVKLII
ncbi:hypothetical protein RHECNPAF_4300109 [Rhizobium etli CNPAF512]|nr:hypothetical protein RHECNPAF_4300109 [Rhizobium etli CNPAF512]